LKVGDVLIVPPGVIHGWADIPDHLDYLSFRPPRGVIKNGWVNPHRRLEVTLFPPRWGIKTTGAPGNPA
jgi:hypothetical protein